MMKNKKIPIALAVAALLLFLWNRRKAVMPKKEERSGPISVVNNNPLNLIKSANAWKGKVDGPGPFEHFVDYYHGLRAGVKNLKTQYGRGYNTIEKLITLWCPPGVEFGNTDRQVDRYIAEVFRAVGIAPHVQFPWTKDTISSMVEAMSAVEAGAPNFHQQTFDKVWSEIQ